MADTDAARGPQPTDITVHEVARTLQVTFADGVSYHIPFELMRVYSPSAEVQGHGPGQEVLQTGKRGVGIVDIQPVGHYAVQPRFSDGHDTGIYSWRYLQQLGRDGADLWRQYEARLQAAGLDRDQPMGRAGGAGGGCASH